MASCGDDTIEIAALGRPFQLGMLYDCRKDALLPGITLWDQQQLQENTSVQERNNTEFNVTTSDSIEEKSNSLNISGSLKLSLLGGLVDVGGSAKYFQDTKKSNNQARVTLQYKTTTKFETLTMSHLGRGQVSHPKVFEDDTTARKDLHTEGHNIIQVWIQYIFILFLYIFRALHTNVEKMCIHIGQSLQSMIFLSATDNTATHVVTAMLYGASAYFVFDRESSSEDVQVQVAEEANITFKKLKFLTANAEAAVNMNEKDKSAIEKFSCTFHGDFKLPTNPTSFSDAVRVYRDLPNMLGENGEHAVPLRVWLYPLCKLDPKAARLQRDISNDLITNSSDIIESLTTAGMRCRDILKDTAAATYPAMEEKIQTVIQKCHQHKLDLMQKLGSVLPSIRGGGKEESALLDILKAHESSPFNSKDLDQWLTNKEKESNTLKSYLWQLEKLGANIDHKWSDLDVRNVVSFTFTSLDQHDGYLLKLSNDLKPPGMLRTSAESSDLQARNTEWLSSDIRVRMREQLKLFGELKNMSTSDDSKFIVTSKYDESHPGACIFIYEDGCDDAIRFVPPSKPATPSTTGVSHDSIRVQVSDPDSATVEYRVEYREKQNQKTEWKSHPVQRNQDAVTLSGLKPETEYEIRATAVGKLSYAVSSDICSAVTVTAVFPPNQLKVSNVTVNCISLKWSIPSDQPCESLKEYIIEYKTNQETEWKSHPVQKNQDAVTLSGLKPETEYEIRATAVSKLSYAVSSDVCRAVTLKAVGPPTEVKVTRVSAHFITLTWRNPSVQHFESLKQYIIEFREESSSQWQTKGTGKEMYTYTLENLNMKTTYYIRMRTDADVGISQHGKECKIKTKIMDKTLIPGDPPVYLLNPTKPENLKNKFNQKVFGSPPATKASNKTIMVVGATGSGKTTLINGMINYILGVEWEDNYRLKLIGEETNQTQACSQTSEVTAYKIHHSDEFHSEVPYSLTIIDTPGFGDTRGIKQDKEITDRMREFFSDRDGINSIDAVCFVVQSALARLTHTQKYIFDAILSIFGKDIASNIIILVTFADGKSPPVLEAIKAANIPTAKNPDESILHFKFNNSVLFAKNTRTGSDENEFDRMFWKLGKASMNKFFSHLSTMNPQSLTLTKEVLEERKQLEATVEGLQPMIRKGLSTLEEINTTTAAIQNQETHMKENKDFEYEVEVDQSEKIIIKSGTFITNCHGCNYTCHFPCGIPKDENKRGCAAIKNDNCTVCPGKCHWNRHFNMTYRWETKRVTEKRTYKELKSKYEAALGKKMSKEKIIKNLKKDYMQVQGETIQMMDTVTKCLKRLSEIALRPDPLATPNYIDLLIESEKQEAKPGFMERIRELQNVRESAVFLQKAAKGIDELTPEEKSIWQKLKSNVKGIFSIFQSK